MTDLAKLRATVAAAEQSGCPERHRDGTCEECYTPEAIRLRTRAEHKVNKVASELIAVAVAAEDLVRFDPEHPVPRILGWFAVLPKHLRRLVVVLGVLHAKLAEASTCPRTIADGPHRRCPQCDPTCAPQEGS